MWHYKTIRNLVNQWNLFIFYIHNIVVPSMVNHMNKFINTQCIDVFHVNFIKNNEYNTITISEASQLE